jgi:phosphoglycolate phosphatase
MFRLIVFDLDGTLVDSERDLADSANVLLQSTGAPPLPEHAVAAMVGEGVAVLVARAFAASGTPVPPDALARFLDIYRARLLVHTRAYNGIPEALERLAPTAALAVLTNKPLALTRAILAGLDLARHFADDGILGGDGPFPRKPDPAGLQYLVASTGVDAASTLLVGDSAIDWRTARQAATAICLARYGFGFRNFPIDALRGDERFIDRPIDLLSYL